MIVCSRHVPVLQAAQETAAAAAIVIVARLSAAGMLADRAAGSVRPHADLAAAGRATGSGDRSVADPDETIVRTDGRACEAGRKGQSGDVWKS